MDITKTPYAEFLEDFCMNCINMKPEKIGVVAMLPGGSVLTGYYGDCSHQDKAVMGYNMNLDAIEEAIEANAKRIIRAAEEEDDEDDR